MNRPVTLREIVGNQIVYAIFLISFYWMWARTDWQAWYQTAQIALACGGIAFFTLQATRIRRYKREGVDEMAEQNLKRCDSLCLKIFVAVMIAAAWVCAVANHTGAIGTGVVGWIIVLSVLALSVIRTAVFAVMDSKGM